jgi:hypothetical protein
MPAARAPGFWLFLSKFLSAMRMPDLHLMYGRFLASFRVEPHRPRG